VAHLGELPVQAIAARPCLITRTQPAAFNCQLLHQLADVIRAVRNYPQMADLAATFALRDRHRYRRLVDIQPDERAILHVVSPPFLRLCARQPGATLERGIPWERPPTQSVQSPIMGSGGG
jgi:hypothetical protein